MPKALQDYINDTLASENYDFRNDIVTATPSPYAPDPRERDPNWGATPTVSTPHPTPAPGTDDWWRLQPRPDKPQGDLPDSAFEPGPARYDPRGYRIGLRAGQAGQGQPVDPWNGIRQGDYHGFFERLFPGETLTSDQLKAQEAALSAVGIKLLPNAAGIYGKIQLPDGTIVDVIQGASSGLNRRQWLIGGGPQGQFDDASGSTIESLANARIARLGQAPDRNLLDQYVQSLLDKEKANQARAGQVANTFRTRASELNAPAYSAGDEAVLRARMFDQFERRRQETLKNEREGVYARGFAPTSGLVQDTQNRVNDRFEQARAGMESDLLSSMIAETQRRRDRAVQLETLAQQALEGGDTTSLQYQANAAEIEDQLLREQDERELAQLAAAAIPEDLTMNRTQLALQIAGLGGSPQNMINTILGLGTFGQNARSLNIQNRNATMGGLGALASLALGILNYSGNRGGNN